jgi:hypothetical protein
MPGPGSGPATLRAVESSGRPRLRVRLMADVRPPARRVTQG